MSKIKIIKEKKSKNSTDIHLQVKSYGDYEIYDWDSEKMISALRDECKISRKDAEYITENVFRDLLKRNKNEIDVSTLKNIVNYHLFDNGYNGVKLSGQINLGMSIHDINALLNEKSSENSNISHNNPEALALTVSENTFKKYALKEVFSNDVSTAHLEGLIHLHDLGQVTKNYAFSKETKIIALIDNSEQEMTLEEIWNNTNSEVLKLNDTQSEKIIDNIKVKDKNEYINLTRIIKSDEEKDMIEFILENDEKVNVTDSHACVVQRDDEFIMIRADEVKYSDKFIKII